MLKSERLKEVIRTKSETEKIDFKESFDKSSTRDWCEIIKDLIAISNSGGGAIIFGVTDNGKIIGNNLDGFFRIDPAVITDKVGKYTGIQVGGFQMNKLTFQKKSLSELKKYILPVLHIPSSDFPIPFEKPGTYGTSDGKQKRAFSKGTVYFRHGAKSEPGTYNDMREFFDKKLEEVRKLWFKNINKVMEAPLGSEMRVLPPEVIETKDKDATKIRLTDDEEAPAYKKIDPDVTHPYRQTDLIDIVNDKLDGRHEINSYDILSIKKVHDLAKEPSFVHNPKFGASQYSEDFADWIVKKYEENPEFFEEARDTMYEIRYGDN